MDVRTVWQKDNEQFAQRLWKYNLCDIFSLGTHPPALYDYYLSSGGPLSHIMFKRRVALKFERNVETFKYLNLWQPFPQRFLAGHSPTCWGLFPAPSIMPEIKMTAVFLWEVVHSAKDLSMNPLRDLYIRTEVLTIAKKLAFMLYERGQSDGGPAAPGRRERWRQSWNTLNRIQKQSLNQVHFSVQSVWLHLRLCERPQTWLPGTSTQRDEA